MCNGNLKMLCNHILTIITKICCIPTFNRELKLAPSPCLNSSAIRTNEEHLEAFLAQARPIVTGPHTSVIPKMHFKLKDTLFQASLVKNVKLG